MNVRANYNFKTVDKEHYLYIAFNGSCKRDNGNQIMREIYTIAEEHTHQKVLLDFKNAVLLETSTLLDYEEVQTAISFPGIFNYRLAALFRPDEINRFSFWETVAVNRGMNIRFFKNNYEAVQWLTM